MHAMHDIKLWSKGYALAPVVERYGAARNAVLDGALARFDVLGSLAHARMLYRVGLLTAGEWQVLDAALRDLYEPAVAGQLAPTTTEEDIHTVIERQVTARAGTPGKQLHTGRSRNDQVLLDLRLYARDALLRVARATLETSGELCALAERHEWLPMPGYTHMQRAMLSSVGLWASAYAEALLDDCAALATAYAVNDRSPLGSAAGYGVPLPLDRAYVAALLGFAGAQHNVLAAANSRGKLEAVVVQALALILLDLSKWAQDVLLFTTREFDFFGVPAELCDGSSIMPQKRNLSALELLRARAQSVVALQGQMLATLVGLPAGYQMDYQETKAPFFEAVSITEESLAVASLYATHLEPHADQLAAACSADLFATDRAYTLSASGVPFRDAYRQVAADPAAEEPGDLVARLRLRRHEGAPGNLDLPGVRARIAAEREAWELRASRVEVATARLLGGLAGEEPSGSPVDTPAGAYYPPAGIALGI